jgi:hypothetical protein
MITILLAACGVIIFWTVVRLNTLSCKERQRAHMLIELRELDREYAKNPHPDTLALIEQSEAVYKAIDGSRDLRQVKDNVFGR